MFAAITMFIIIWICMWIFYKFMYPRAPKSMMPKDGDVTTLRHCNFCGHSLAEYRGVVETNTEFSARDEKNELFFCNYEHQADSHAGKSYQS